MSVSGAFVSQCSPELAVSDQIKTELAPWGDSVSFDLTKKGPPTFKVPQQVDDVQCFLFQD